MQLLTKFTCKRVGCATSSFLRANFTRPFSCSSKANGEANKHRSALVTGSTSGIGLTMAQELASHGYYVIITGFGDKDSALSQVRQSATDNGFDESRIEYIDANLSKRDECINLFEKCAQFVARKEKELCKDNENNVNNNNGYVNILINNAGFQHVCNIETFPLDTFEEMQKVMYFAPYYLMQQWFKHLCNMPSNNKYGRLINVSSVHGRIASLNKSSYIGAKHGVIGYTKAAALELAQEYPEYNVTSNAICPGFIETELVKNQIRQRMEKSGNDYPTEAYNLVSEKHATGKFVQPIDIAKLVMYLCSEEAHQVTGTTLTIDGAWSTG